MIEMGVAVLNSLKSDSFERNLEWLSQIRGKSNLDILMCTRESCDVGIEQYNHKLDLNLSDADKRAVQDLIVKIKTNNLLNDGATHMVKHFRPKRGRLNSQSGKQLESADAYLLKKKLTHFDNRKGSNFGKRSEVYPLPHPNAAAIIQEEDSPRWI
jgi:hypothetical protein